MLGKKVKAVIDSGSDLHLVRASFYVMLGNSKLKQKIVSFEGVGASARRC